MGPHLTEEAVLRVSARSAPQDLAAAIAHACYEGRPPKLRAIGAGSVNQAMKAVAIANSLAGSRGITIVVRPSFTSVPGRVEGEVVSAMVFACILT
jgi:stage V sporulation protein S